MAMQLEGNKYVLLTVGVVELPDCITRLPKNDGWMVKAPNLKIRFLDKDFKEDEIYCLKKAVAFAAVFGQTANAEIIEKRMVEMQKDRLRETGVTGVYHRSGLQEYYLVKLGGFEAIIEYNKGKGFVEACRQRDRIKTTVLDTAYTKLFAKLGLA